MKIEELIYKAKRRWARMRLEPIYVYCLHHVCADFDSESMLREDWMSIAAFKSEIQTMQQNGVEFISLMEAYQHMRDDRIRKKKYAVLTFDDGYESQKEILPWLAEQHIPATLFLNPAYLDGKHFRKSNAERYMSEQDARDICEQYPLVSIGSHGWEHEDVLNLSVEKFTESLVRSINYLKELPSYIPFYAYPYGHCTGKFHKAAIQQGVIPLFVSGNKNYSYHGFIDRDTFENYHKRNAKR